MADPGGGGPAGSAGSSGAGSSGAGNDDSSEGMGEGQDNTGIADAAGYGSGSTSGGTGEGRQDGPGSPTEGNQYGGPTGSSTEGTATERGLIAGINAAIAAGLDPYSSKAQNVIAAGIMSGRFGNPESFGISVDMESPEVAGFVDQYSGQNIGEKALGAFGYNTNKSIGQNIFDTITPGKQTPLGIISAVPSMLGMNPATQLGITAANKALGIMGIGVEKDTTMSSIQDTINDMNSKLY